jgi:hypothetical protein
MKKEIRDVDKERGIVRVTTSDERYYLRPVPNEKTGLPEYKTVPSVTWVAGFYPKGTAFYRWLSEHGWDEAEAIKVAAGDKGSAVHKAIEMILNDEPFRIDTKVLTYSGDGMVERELTYEELLCVKSFCDWREAVKPEVISTEITVFSDIHGYAGTVDLICRIDGVPYVVDFKTSKQVWTEHELQISAYRMALENGENPIKENSREIKGKIVDLSGLKTAILQVGYSKNKAGYKWTEIEDAFPMFKVAQQIWKREVGDNTPGFTQKDFPLVLSAGKKVEEITKGKKK